jgi:peroxiredoxin
VRTRSQAKKRRQVPPKSRNYQAFSLALVGVGLILISLVTVWVLVKADEPSASAQSSGSGSSPSAIPVAVEFPAPDIQLVDLNGNPVQLSDFKGQTVLLNNWAIWCPPCKAEMPVLQAYYNKYRDQGFTIIGIEAGEQPAGVAAFVDEYRLTFPVWPDPQQQSMQAFQAFSLPNSYVVDPSGIVRLAWTGAISAEMLENYVTPLLME